MTTNELWIVMVVLPFSSLNLKSEIGISAEIKIEDGGPNYFCPVFSSREEAETWSRGRYLVLPLSKMQEEQSYH